MKNKPFFVFLLLFSVSIFSQKGEIYGKITDKDTAMPLELVSIVCKWNETSVKSVFSDVKGQFSINDLPLVPFELEVSYLGYETKKQKLSLTVEKPLENIDFKLISNREQLEEVAVSTKKTTIIQKTDRKIINVGNDLVSSGTNALGLLQNIPFVLVEQQNQSISLRGSGKTRIFIDGKPSSSSSLQVLKQVQSSNIKRIELITNPSAKYTAEGTGGIINIILKKNRQLGFNASYTVGVERGENTRPSLSTNFNYRVGKVNFFGNYGVDIGKINTYSSLYRTNKSLDQDMKFSYEDVYQNIKLGADVYINEKNTFSFYTKQAFDRADYLINTVVSQKNKPNFIQDVNSNINLHEQLYNIDYKTILGKNDESLELDITYSRMKTPEDNIFTEVSNSFFNKVTNNVNFYLFNVDYVKPFSSTSKIETGVDVRLFSVFNKLLSNQVFLGNKAGSSQLNYDRNTYALYGIYHKDFQQFSFQLGVRLESFLVAGVFKNTRVVPVKEVAYKNDIFNVYPSFHLTYFPTDNDEFYASFSRRVDRPSLEQIAPIPDFSTPLTISIGNQYLQPQYKNTLEANYTRSFKKGYVSLGSIYRITNNRIDRTIFVEPQNPDYQVLSYINGKGIDEFGFELYSNFRLNKWFTTDFSAFYYNQDRKGIVNNNAVTVKNHRFYTTINNSFTVSKKLSFQLYGLFVAKTKTPQFDIKPYGKLDVAAKLRVFDNKGVVNFRITDILETQKLRFSSLQPLPQRGFMYTELRRIYVGFTYNFGSGKNKARKRKQRDKNETQASGGIL